MKKVLITGFEPFGGASINPALEAVKQLEAISFTNATVVTCQVPVARFKAIDTVISAIEYHQPNIVITVGQAGGRAAITPERIAINADDFRITDNDGTLPIKAITQALQQQGIPCQVSNTAGTFGCNHLFYGIQHYLRDSNTKHGFIHIPLLPEQAPAGDQPSMSLDTIVLGLKIAIEATVNNEQDISVGAGTIC